ncbi:hypothetical protein CLV46_0765 [Diaminobutyricimonas aerilata]|uniref:Hemagglutinin n=1 Tax=Diaminobutyricimonas aerilata TaxID=1162967 RepID=A0A2M9CH27_9MICO|nr:hypothetical protein [Diaminobutyricimonas aerilata]PJJ71223.1 hypothetical protein CLV46_0765 [Diaminobutyricimonas aerilata]
MRRIKISTIPVLIAVFATFLTVGNPSRAEAVVGSDFDPGYIISDQAFFDSGSMGEGEVQRFLEAQMPRCAGANGQACLRDYSSSTFTRAAVGANHCGAYEGAASERASRIIAKVAQACGISPRVLLVMLQKEQGLVTAASPTERQYRVAMGYGCPDTAPCDAQFYGFYNQVYKAAWQFRQYAQRPTNWRYRIGNVAVQYHPNAACGAPVVNIRNQATANLYNYTPYQPNAAALNNLRGSGDACSSYGNRNFWVFYNDWFGSPTGPVSPLGSIDLISTSPGQVRVGGWAFDPNSKNPIDTHIYINGVGYILTASQPRPDLPPVFGDIGPNHGFDGTFPTTTGGAQEVCVYGINIGPGSNTLIGCRTVQGMSGSPIGNVEAVSSARGSISVSGWAIDPDSVGAVSMHVYVDSQGSAHDANQDRADVGAAYPAYGSGHGFNVSIPASSGTHNVCVYGINVGAGSNRLFGCWTATVATGSPTGVVEAITSSPGAVSVSGWALDPDTADPIPVHVYVGSQGKAVLAEGARPDIARAFPGYGERHGFNVVMPAAPGASDVCAYAINVGGGVNRLLSCTRVTGMSGSPVGVIDYVARNGNDVQVGGWAFDPDTADPIVLTIEVDGVRTDITGNGSRPDVGSAYPAYGPNHGYSATIPTTPGSHNVCVTARNVSNGTDVRLGCRQLAG